MKFQISSRRENREIPESSRLEFFEKFLANNFGLPDAEDNTYKLLNRGSIADLPNVQRAKFMDSDEHFYFIQAYTSSTTSRTFLQ